MNGLEIGRSLGTIARTVPSGIPDVQTSFHAALVTAPVLSPMPALTGSLDDAIRGTAAASTDGAVAILNAGDGSRYAQPVAERAAGQASPFRFSVGDALSVRASDDALDLEAIRSGDAVIRFDGASPGVPVAV